MTPYEIRQLAGEAGSHEWAPIPSCGRAYFASPAGQIRSASGSIVGQWKNDQGYCLVRLSSPRVVKRVHRLIAEAFLPNPDCLPVVNHLNHDRADNRAANLEWTTQAGNLHHANNAGRMQKDYWRGKRGPNRITTEAIEDDVRRIREATSCSYSVLGRHFGLSKRTIGRILTDWRPLPAGLGGGA